MSSREGSGLGRVAACSRIGRGSLRAGADCQGCEYLKGAGGGAHTSVYVRLERSSGAMSNQEGLLPSVKDNLSGAEALGGLQSENFQLMGISDERFLV